MPKRTFSTDLHTWLSSKEPKTLANLIDVFSEKSFAVTLLLLMFLPATPLPTGGVTHIFEVVAMLLALEMIAGRKVLWLPQKWQKVDISKIAESKAMAMITRRINWVESHSKPRLQNVLKHPLFLRLTGLVFLILCLAAFAAPPFSGLDTLPSLGVVVVALSLIFEDIIFYIAGLLIGGIGIGLVIALGAGLIKSIQHFF